MHLATTPNFHCDPHLPVSGSSGSATDPAIGGILISIETDRMIRRQFSSKCFSAMFFALC
jgi:hypothetical protein